MSCLTELEISTGYVDQPLADDLVHGELLKQAVSIDIPNCINAIIDVINGLTGDDNKLADNSVYLRMLAEETREAIGGFKYFWECDGATTANITLSGEQTIDGVARLAGDVILAKDQTDPTENSIYTVAAGDWIKTSLEIDGSHHAWILTGTENGGTSRAMNPDQDATDWVIYYQPPDQTLTSDQLAALAGTEGTPSAANKFVTDQDPRLQVFTDSEDGLVPAPGASSGNTRFLSEAGLWIIPTTAEPDSGMFLGVDNVMTAGGFITFPSAIGIRGLADPVAGGDACNKTYADAIFASLSASLSAHTALTNNPHSTDLTNIGGATVTRATSSGAVVANSVHKMLTIGITSTLPASPSDGQWVSIQNLSGGIVTIAGNGKTIEGSASITISAGNRFLFFFDSTANDWTAS